jgi:hypothetical protein
MKYLRNIYKMSWKNDGFRSLYESAIYPEVTQSLEDWKSNYEKLNYVLVGGLALSFYLKPRPTQDIDLIFLSYDDIRDRVDGFKKTRKHAFIHLKHQVEIELLTPEHLNCEKSRFKKIFDTSIESDGIKVSSPLSLIVMKLSRYNVQDKADIHGLLEYCRENMIDLDISDYNLNNIEIKNFDLSINTLNEKKLHQNTHELECSYIIENLNTVKINTCNLPYDVYVSEGGYYEPCFYFGKNIGKRIKKFEDFTFIVKIPDYIGEKLEIIGSSTDYKSFNGFKIEESKLIDWLCSSNESGITNLEFIKNKWNKLNNN